MVGDEGDDVEQSGDGTVDGKAVASGLMGVTPLTVTPVVLAALPIQAGRTAVWGDVPVPETAPKLGEIEYSAQSPQKAPPEGLIARVSLTYGSVPAESGQAASRVLVREKAPESEPGSGPATYPQPTPEAAPEPVAPVETKPQSSWINAEPAASVVPDASVGPDATTGPAINRRPAVISSANAARQTVSPSRVTRKTPGEDVASQTAAGAPPQNVPPHLTTPALPVTAAPLRDGMYQPSRRRPSEVVNATSSDGTPRSLGGTTARPTCVVT